MNSSDFAACLKNVTLRYKKVTALDDISINIPAKQMVGLIGPDGVGKSSMMALISGSRAIQNGSVEVLGMDMKSADNRRIVCPKIAYMPQGLGKNLYPTLSIYENLDFFARLFGYQGKEKDKRIKELTSATGLFPFLDRAAGKLSGGMKQKLGLCCALIHDPELLILDEPTTGVDPLSRRQFWELIDKIRLNNSQMSVIVATAYMEEAERFDHLIAMYGGKILDSGKPQEILDKTNSKTLEEAFIELLPEEKRVGYKKVTIPQQDIKDGEHIAIEAKDLTMRFGDFTAVNKVSFRIKKGEIFGFLGSNGCGKTTTMKMLTGLLTPTEGKAWLFGKEVDPKDINTRRRVGYMSQSFSLYTELTVEQNLLLHARLFEVPKEEINARVNEMAERFELTNVKNKLPDALPLGVRQRLSLAVAMIHKPEMLILDEPTSGVDPVARDAFWQSLGELSRNDGVTIFISTHFMNEAERCDRISLMHAGKVLAVGTPKELIKSKNTDTLENAFIAYLEEVSEIEENEQEEDNAFVFNEKSDTIEKKHFSDNKFFDLKRFFSYGIRESLELMRDPIRLTLALLGNLILMAVMGYGITMDVEDLKFAVLDRDQTTTSRDYTLNISGSRYFIEKDPIISYEDLEHRLQSGKISLAIEIPPGFAKDIARGRPVEIGAWIDGAMPTRAETIKAYVQGMHRYWLTQKARESGQNSLVGFVNIETRFRYNPDLKSLVAMVPAVIPLLLMMIPAMLATLSVVREKELGSIINFYVTPSTRLEFLIGKQTPYVILSMVSFLLLVLMAVTIFRVPFTGSFIALTLGAFFYIIIATSLGLLISTFTKSQIAALFASAVLTLIPAAEYSGMIDPVSSLEGTGKFIGNIYPTTHFLIIARGTFSKALTFSDLYSQFASLLISIPVLIAISAILLKKQEK